MTDFEKSVISLLKVIANGQMVMINVMPKMVGRDDLIRLHGQLVESVFESLKSNAEFERLSQQLRDQAGDGTREQTSG